MTASKDIQTIAVVGAGTMGQGIAQICAMANFRVVLFDVREESLTSAVEIITKNLNKGIELGKVSDALKDQTLANIQTVKELNQVKADVIIEAIVEQLKVKQELFQSLEKVNEEDCILASNTSSIPITQIAAGLKRPQHFVGMHFFNPAHIMKLVEIISGAATSSDVVKTVYALAEKLGKKPVVAQDAPGFIVNRVARHYYVESLKVLEEGVTDVAGIDKLLEASGFKMGPFRLMDLIGVDTNFSVTSSMFNAFYQDSKFRPSRIQQQKVDAGHHGRKSGKGFYTYD